MNFSQRFKASEVIHSPYTVARFHTVVTTRKQTVGEHSAEVALLCTIILGSACTAPLLLNALNHDRAELITGDMPGNIKRHLGGFPLLEIRADQELGIASVPLSLTESSVLKFADLLSGALFIIEQLQCGNRHPSLLNCADNYLVTLVNKLPEMARFEGYKTIINLIQELKELLA